MERDLTHGSIGRNILRFSLPYFLSYFLQTLYGMADLFIIGQFDSVSGTTACVGVDIISTIGFTKNNKIHVKTMEIPKNKVIVFPMIFDVSFFNFAPTDLPIITVVPIAIPTIITVIICIT